MHTYTKKGSRALFILKSAKASRNISGRRHRYGPVAGYMHGACLAVDSDEALIFRALENDPSLSRPRGTVTASPKLRVGRARNGLALRRLGSSVRRRSRSARSLSSLELRHAGPVPAAASAARHGPCSGSLAGPDLRNPGRDLKKSNLKLEVRRSDSERRAGPASCRGGNPGPARARHDLPTRMTSGPESGGRSGPQYV
jgi:hypothetical protein